MVCSGRTRRNNFKLRDIRFRLHVRKKKLQTGRKNGGLEKATLGSVCGCTGCRDAAAFGTNSAWNFLWLPLWCRLLPASLLGVFGRVKAWHFILNKNISFQSFCLECNMRECVYKYFLWLMPLSAVWINISVLSSQKCYHTMLLRANMTT